MDTQAQFTFSRGSVALRYLFVDKAASNGCAESPCKKGVAEMAASNDGLRENESDASKLDSEDCLPVDELGVLLGVFCLEPSAKLSTKIIALLFGLFFTGLGIAIAVPALHEYTEYRDPTLLVVSVFFSVIGLLVLLLSAIFIAKPAKFPLSGKGFRITPDGLSYGILQVAPINKCDRALTDVHKAVSFQNYRFIWQAKSTLVAPILLEFVLRPHSSWYEQFSLAQVKCTTARAQNFTIGVDMEKIVLECGLTAIDRCGVHFSGKHSYDRECWVVDSLCIFSDLLSEGYPDAISKRMIFRGKGGRAMGAALAFGIIGSLVSWGLERASRNRLAQELEELKIGTDAFRERLLVLVEQGWEIEVGK